MTEYFKAHQKYGRKVIRAAKAAGYAIGVRYEDGDIALKASTKHTEKALMEELYACACGTLFFYDHSKIDGATGRATRLGAIFFIHVNEPEESITDYHDNPEMAALVAAATGTI